MDDLITVCNVNIHRDAKISPNEMLTKLKHVKALRTWDSMNEFPYFISNKGEVENLKYLHRSLNSGDIKFESSKENKCRYVFGITFCPNCYGTRSKLDLPPV